MTVSNTTGTPPQGGIPRVGDFWDSWNNQRDPFGTGTPRTDQDWWKEINKQINNARPPVIEPPTKKPSTVNKTLRFKGVVFTISMEEGVFEFFEDEKNISSDEMRLIEVAYPSDYKRIKSAWMDAWKNLQASRAFDEY